jgi:hypothetical protein
MVHPVQTPEKGYLVEKDMLRVDSQIEEQNSHDSGCCFGNAQQVEDPPAALFAQEGDTDGSGGEDNTHRRGI